MHNIDTIFQNYFPKLATELKEKGYSLKENQKKVVENVLIGNNTLCIMPTGGGKSLIYWLSGLAVKGITLVITPLIALIDEQTEKIREHGYEVLAIHGGTNTTKNHKLIKDLYNHSYTPQFIFVSPERLATDGFFEYCLQSRKNEINLVVIDEVHCVSQWGINFRPFYKRIPEFLNQLYGTEQWHPRILALTATLNSKEVIDICKEFRIKKENIIKDDYLIRSEINLKVLKFLDEDEKEEKFWDLLKIHKKEKILVYLYRKYNQRGVEDLTEKAKIKGYNAISFHGDLSAKERQDIITKFKIDEINIIFATNAFGMGIDIPDIRTVIHFMLPESVEQYYQEVGRAARDKGAANAYILYTNKNISVKKTYFIDNSLPSIDELNDVFGKVTNNQIGLKTLQYFENEEIQRCLSYFLEHDLLNINCKGFTNLKVLTDIKDKELERFYNSSKTKSIITTIKNTNINPKDLVNLVYKSILDNKAKLLKNFDKCLIIENHVDQISNSLVNALNTYIEGIREYKHKLLDYFVYLLDEDISSNHLHQEIGKYLAVPKHQLNKIHKTANGEYVRSKSEVIIANLLHKYKLDYTYEKKLYYNTNQWIEPDFTIKLSNGKEVYWEHLGMIGTESYDNRWIEKLDIYEKHFNNQLYITYEGTTISDSTIKLINELKQL